MRCENCSKFVSYDEPQCQVDDISVDDNVVHVNVTVTLTCAECGSELKQANIEAEEEVTDEDHVCDESRDKSADGDAAEWSETDKFEAEGEGDPEGTDRLETEKNGKHIPARYAKKFYGFSLDTDVKCKCCGEVFSKHLEGEEQASAFDEC